MKTICFIIKKFPTVSETFVTNQILQTKAQGYKVLILTKRLLPINASSQQELLNKNNIIAQTYKVDFQIPRSQFKRRATALYLIMRYFIYWRRVKNVSTRKRFSTLPFQLHFYNQFRAVSVFHVQFASAGLEIAKMKSIGMLRGNIITTFHGYDAHFENEDKLALLQERYRLLLGQSHYITVNTPYLYDKVMLLGGEIKKLKIIPMGIDIEAFRSKQNKIIQKEAPTQLISVGRLVKLKGFDYAIQSIKIILDKGYDIIYTIVGEGSERENLSNLVSELGLTKTVNLVGAKNQDEIKELLDNSHIYLMSSIIDNSNRAEAQGVVTAEAQAMGLPVVGFRCGGVPYTISENKTGILVEEKRIDDYADAIIKLVDDPILCKSMSALAKDFAARNFSNENMSSEFFQLYN